VIAKLVLENLKHKPMRSALSTFLIAIPVTLILTLVGLSEGMLADSARRAEGVGADIWVRPPGSSVLTLSGAPLPEKMVEVLGPGHEPHVKASMGMINHPISSTTYVAGIDMDSFNRMSGGFRYVQGGPFQRPDDIILDEPYAQQNKVRAGDTINLLNHNWHVAGIVEPGKLSHIFLPMHVVQTLSSNTGKISQVFLKVDDPANIPLVISSLKKRMGDYQIYSVAEFTSLLTVNNVQGGALRNFINVMVGIGVVIGFAVVLLSMYMAVLQRTREIGILKSLGASRWFILQIILAEAIVMGIAGTILGILFSYGARWLILTLYPASLSQAIVPHWWPIAGGITLIGVTLGAMYPGLSAARQDPIEALAYE
jgi:putative ABC transport system permease protein